MVEPTAEPATATAAEPEAETIEDPVTVSKPVIESTPTTIADRREVTSVPNPIRTSMEDQASLRMQENANAANPDQSTPMSPTSPGGGKVKNWLKTKFSRRMSKSQKSPGPAAEKEKDAEKGFVGGAALTGATGNNSTTSLGRQREVSLERAMQENAESRGRGATGDDDEVSALSVPTGNRTEEDEEFQEARDNFDEDLAPPPTFVATKSSSPARETRFSEDI